MNIRVLHFLILTLTSPYLTATNQKQNAGIAAGAGALKRSASAPSNLCRVVPITILLYFSSRVGSLQSNCMQVTTYEDMSFNQLKIGIARCWNVDSQRLLLVDKHGVEYPQNSEKGLTQLGIFHRTKILAFR